MNDKLLRDVGIVFLFWFVILYVLSGFPLSLVPNVVGGSLLIWVIGIGAGGCVAWMFAYGNIENDRRRVTDKTRDMNASASIMDADETKTLYQVRLPKPEPAAIAATSKTNPLRKESWWGEYRTRHPHYARFLDEVYALMQTKPGLPAGYNGGHGSTTLVEHSMHVVDAILAIAPNWHFDGIKGRRGQTLVPLLDSSGTSSSLGEGSPLTCPILPVLAFSHDIGKVECFVQDKDGQVKTTIPGHGMRGAALLRRLPAIWSLPEKDRNAMLLCVEYYHGLSQMPVSKWVGDRTRSLTALLYVADCQASGREGYKPEAAAEAREMYLPDETTETAAPDESVSTPEADKEELGDGLETENVAEENAHDDDIATHETSATSNKTEEVTLDNGATLMDALVETLRVPDAINGKNTDRRIAFKYGGWVFVLERAFGDAFMRFSGNRFSNDYRNKLLEAIHAEDALLLEAGNVQLKPKNALWKLVLARPGDNVAQPPAHPGFVFRTQLIPGLDSFSDCAFCPAIKTRDGLVRIEGKTEEAESTASPMDEDVGDTSEVGGALPELSAGVLKKLASLEEATHGRVVKTSQKTGATAALFRKDSLSESYIFDQDNLPEGIIRMQGRDGTAFLGVVM